MQYELLRLLVAGRNDLFLVGDPAQAIYGFNGADPSLLVDVDRHLPGVEVVRLDDEPPIDAADRRRRNARAGRVRPAWRRRLGARRRSGGRGPRRRRRARRGRARRPLRRRPPARTCWAAARSPCSPAPTSSWPRCGRRSIAAGVAVHQQAIPPGSPLAAAVATATALRSAAQLRAWAHDVLEPAPPAVGATMAARRAGRTPRRRSCARVPARAALRRRQRVPFVDRHDGVFAQPGSDVGVELLTFHAAKGREWHTVVVTGVETGLVPHRSATTLDAKAEEARLLHVAMTQGGRPPGRHVRRATARLRPQAEPVHRRVADRGARRSSPRRHVVDQSPDLVALRTDSLQSWRRTAARGRGAAAGADLLRRRSLGDRRGAAVEPRRAVGAGQLRPGDCGAGVRADQSRPRRRRRGSAYVTATRPRRWAASPSSSGRLVNRTSRCGGQGARRRRRS